VIASIADLTPNTGDWHVANVGMLIGNLQSLEFSARVAIAEMNGSRSHVDLCTVQPGEWVREDPMTNYDQLSAVLKRFNGLASPTRQLDVQKIVDLRAQLAHGRVASFEPTFPLTLFKFGKPVRGKVPVLARIEMTEEWFRAQRRFVHDALQTVGDEFYAPRLNGSA